MRAGQYLLVCAVHVRRRAGGAKAVLQQLIHCLGEPPEFAQPGAPGRLEPARQAGPHTGQRDQQPAVPVRERVGGLGEEALHRGRVPDEFGDHRRVRTGELHRGQAGVLGGEPPVFGAGEYPAAARGVVVQELRPCRRRTDAASCARRPGGRARGRRPLRSAAGHPDHVQPRAGDERQPFGIRRPAGVPGVTAAGPGHGLRPGPPVGRHDLHPAASAAGPRVTASLRPSGDQSRSVTGSVPQVSCRMLRSPGCYLAACPDLSGLRRVGLLIA